MSPVDPSVTAEVDSRSALLRTGSIGHQNAWICAVSRGPKLRTSCGLTT